MAVYVGAREEGYSVISVCACVCVLFGGQGDRVRVFGDRESGTVTSQQASDIARQF